MIKSIITKSLKDPTDKSADGLRILIARFRPRYLPKDEENWDLWCKELAPSRELWKEYVKDESIDWSEYSRKYIKEIKDNSQAIQLLKTLAFFVNGKKDINLQEHQPSHQKIYDLIQKYDAVTLLCHCKDEKFCHRSIVKNIIYSEH